MNLSCAKYHIDFTSCAGLCGHAGGYSRSCTYPASGHTKLAPNKQTKKALRIRLGLSCCAGLRGHAGDDCALCAAPAVASALPLVIHVPPPPPPPLPHKWTSKTKRTRRSFFSCCAGLRGHAGGDRALCTSPAGDCPAPGGPQARTAADGPPPQGPGCSPAGLQRGGPLMLRHVLDP